MATKHLPDGYHTITPYFTVDGAQKLVDFLKQVFNAKERMRMPGAGGKIGHAEFEIGDSLVMLADTTPEYPAGKSNSLYIYVEDVDATYKRALQAGATSIREPQTMFYGDRSGQITDSFGNFWGIATHVEDVPPAEMKKRAEEFQKQAASA